MIEQNYKITRDDYIRFNMSHAKQSKITKLLILTLRISIPLILIAYAIYVGEITNPVYMGVLTVFVLPWVIFSPRLIWMNMVKKINTILDESNVGDLFSQRKITLSNEKVIDKTDTSSTNYEWSDFTELKLTESAIYLYTNSEQAVILPLRELKQKKKILEMINKNTGLTNQ